MKFANSQVQFQSWHYALMSAEVPAGRVRGLELFGHKLALFRGRRGALKCFTARCPHLGASLAAGDVVGDDLRCAFHHWKFNGEGRCIEAPCLPGVPAARVRSWPVVERQGIVWVFNAAEPWFPVPQVAGLEDAMLVPQNPVVLAAHPSLVACNGIDVQHYRAAHGLQFDEEPSVERLDDYRTEVRLRLVMPYRILHGLSGRVLPMTFTTWGPYLATGRIEVKDWLLGLIFTNRAHPRGTYNRTFLLLPRGRWVARALLQVMLWVGDRVYDGDRAILDGLDFRPNLTEA
ncbi:MAG TPA: Rieske 2Fe-2S domain-containing protein, partial [Candidatus Xenobia bacterium]